MRVADVHSGGAVVPGDIERREMFRRGRAPELLRRANLLRRCLIIGASHICPLQRLVHAHGGQRFVRRLIGEIKFLSGWQSYGACQGKFLLRIIVAGDNELLLTGLKFHLRAQGINRRRDAGSLLIVRFIE